MRKKVVKKLRKAARAIALISGHQNVELEMKRLKKIHKENKGQR